MTECTTRDCGNPTSLYLCGRCRDDLQAWIDKIPALYDDLFTTMAKLDNTTPQSEGGGSSPTAQLPLRPGAMEARHALLPWIFQNAERLAHNEDAATYVHTVRALVEHGEKIIDTPAELFTHGPCGTDLPDGTKCATVIRAAPDATWANCETCEAPINITERKTKRLEDAKILEPLPAKAAREWVKRNTGLTVKTGDFLNWVKTDKLRYVHERVVTTDKPTRVYFPHEVYRVTVNMLARRRHIA
jgi:hypothetical protein